MTGGGTAGHVTPNIALMPSLRKAGYEISYIGSYEGIEKRLKQQYPHLSLLFLDFDSGTSEANVYNRLFFLLNR